MTINYLIHQDRFCVVTFLIQSFPAWYRSIVSRRQRSAVPGVSPGRGLLIPHGYLHLGKSELSEV